MFDNQDDLALVVEKYGGREVGAVAFYRKVFASEYFESSDQRAQTGHMGNPLLQIGVTVQRDGKSVVTNFTHIVTNDRHKDFCLFNRRKNIHHVYCSGLGYIGKRRTLSRATQLFALIFDIDFQTPQSLERLLFGMQTAAAVYPPCNALALSGSGVHLYYIFEEPLPLYTGRTAGRKTRKALNALKHALTSLLWNPITVETTDAAGENPQYQGINQAFRVIGSRTKRGGTCRGFLFDTTPLYTSTDALYRWVDKYPELRDAPRYMAGSDLLDLDYWKDRSPRWYEKRVIRGDKTQGHWQYNRAVYDRWLALIKEQARPGHRYHCMMTAVINAKKCGVPRTEVEQTLREDLAPRFSAQRPEDPITEKDIEDALTCYADSYYTYPLRSMEALAAVRVDRQRRNGRRQDDHLRRARAVQAVDDPDGTWRNRDGAPTKETQVKAWRAAHPTGTRYACQKDLGISKNTVKKWWD